MGQNFLEVSCGELMHRKEKYKKIKQKPEFCPIVIQVAKNQYFKKALCCGYKHCL